MQVLQVLEAWKQLKGARQQAEEEEAAEAQAVAQLAAGRGPGKSGRRDRM